MSRRKRYLDIDVLEAARQRLHHIFDLFDSVAVCFSGGKDSLATLELTWEVAQERGLDHVDVVFRDEELIPEQVIDFVNEYRVKPWVRMLYFAVPLKSTKYILGRAMDYVQWDPARPHIRPIPPHAIRQEAADSHLYDQYTMDAYVASYYRGKVALVTGIRAAESLMRYRASVNKLSENYINATDAVNASLCKPLYDWEENDVFKFFMEREIRYCSLYDAQHLAGHSLRVSTPLHAESAKEFGRLRAVCPLFYQQVVNLFPEMLEQERYFADLDRSAVVRQYGADLAGVKAYILEHIQNEHQLEKALKHYAHISGMKDQSGYAPAYVLKYFMAGQFKRMLLPQGKEDRHE